MKNEKCGSATVVEEGEKEEPHMEPPPKASARQTTQKITRNSKSTDSDADAPRRKCQKREVETGKVTRSTPTPLRARTSEVTPEKGSTAGLSSDACVELELKTVQEQKACIVSLIAKKELAIKADDMQLAKDLTERIVIAKEIAALMHRKKKAMDNDDFDTADVLKREIAEAEAGITKLARGTARPVEAELCLGTHAEALVKPNTLDEQKMHIVKLHQQKKAAIDNEDYARADVLKNEIKAAEAGLKRKHDDENNDSCEVDSRIENLKRQKQHAIEHEDYKKANALKMEITKAEATREAEKKEGKDGKADPKAMCGQNSRIAMLSRKKKAAIEREDYQTAGVIQSEIENLEATLKAVTPSMQEQKLHIAALKQKKCEAIEAEDYSRADVLKTEIEEAEAVLNGDNNDPHPEDLRIDLLSQQKQEAIDRNDFQAAAALKSKIQDAIAALEEQKQNAIGQNDFRTADAIARRLQKCYAGNGTATGTAVANGGAIPHVVREIYIEDLQNTNTVLGARVKLCHVRYLSESKVNETRGKGKGDAKGKGKKGKKGKGDAKGKPETGSQQAVYFGDDSGLTVCTLAFDGDLKNVGQNEFGTLMDVDGLKPRPGQPDLLHWCDVTKMNKLLEPMHREAGFSFNYVANIGSTDFVTKETLQERKLASFVSMLLFVNHAEQKYTQTNEKYLAIHAVDTNSQVVGPMNFWGWAEDEVFAGNHYVFRGLRVAQAKTWDYEAWKWVTDLSGERIVEYSNRTAVEDVSTDEAVKALFPR